MKQPAGDGPKDGLSDARKPTVFRCAKCGKLITAKAGLHIVMKGRCTYHKRCAPNDTKGVRSITFTRHPGSRGHDIKHVMLNGVMIGWITLNRPTGMFQFSEIGDEVHSTIQSSDVRSS
jgi:hypothetical protein